MANKVVWMLIHGGDVTTYGLETQTSAILVFFRLRFWPDCRNLHAILNQIRKLRPNRAIRGAVMTYSMQFQMAAAVAQYYFRFRI